uniref:Uncharacterized protein n=1 Tax=Rhizophora mucronata TaxID=61149 RepID=A0A2P2PX62_RHIMU
MNVIFPGRGYTVKSLLRCFFENDLKFYLCVRVQIKKRKKNEEKNPFLFVV